MDFPDMGLCSVRFRARQPRLGPGWLWGGRRRSELHAGTGTASAPTFSHCPFSNQWRVLWAQAMGRCLVDTAKVPSMYIRRVVPTIRVSGACALAPGHANNLPGPVSFLIRHLISKCSLCAAVCASRSRARPYSHAIDLPWFYRAWQRDVCHRI